MYLKTFQIKQIKKLVFVLACLLLAILNSNGQGNISYNELTPLLNLITINRVPFISKDEELVNGVRNLSWNLRSEATYETLYQEIKDKLVDYRYFFIISRSANFHYREDYSSNSNNIIDYYYSLKFLNLAIKSPKKNYFIINDSLKYLYVQQFYYSTFHDSTFHSFPELKEAADNCKTYCNDLLKSNHMRFGNEERSRLYYIIAESTFKADYIEGEDKSSLNSVFKNLTFAINEYKNNIKAIYDRANYKKEYLLDTLGAIVDYQRYIIALKNLNEDYFVDVKKGKRKILEDPINLKDLFAAYIDLGECYYQIGDYKNSLICNRHGLNEAKHYENIGLGQNSNLIYFKSSYYFCSALCYYYLGDKKSAKNAIDSAVNFGYNIEECQNLMSDINNDFSNESNSVKMESKNGVYEIPITINEVLKINFVFDAGATDVQISNDVALTLIRTGTITENDFVGTKTYQFADGSLAKSNIFIIKSLCIGKHKIFNTKVAISNSNSAPLLLGQNVLKKFGRVTIDYKNQQIIFNK